MLGTIVNSLAIIGGSIIGLIINGRLSQKVSETIMKGLSLSVLYIGISGTLKCEDPLEMIICMAVGCFIGEIIDFDKKLSNLGTFLENIINKNKKNKEKQVSISEGFVTSSLLFCVGAMAVVGSLESGLQNNHNTLFAKSILDGTSSIIFTSSLGIGVIFSAAAVFLYQGTITLLARMLSSFLNDSVITSMSAIGSLLIIGLGLNMTCNAKIKVANMIPAMFLPMVYVLFK